jgi:heme exporter protein B
MRQLSREWHIQMRQIRVLVNSCLFFLMVLVFFPLTMPPDPLVLRTMMPGLVWIAALFALLLSSDRLFQADYEDGIIEQWLLSPDALYLKLSAKLLMHWFLNTFPMVLLCPFLALLFGLSLHELVVVMLSLVAGTPVIAFLCALAAAFSTGLKQKGVLMALLVLPLTIPVMIFGSSALSAAMQGLPVQGYLALLCALSCVCVAFLPFAVAGVIRIALV